MSGPPRKTLYLDKCLLAASRDKQLNFLKFIKQIRYPLPSFVNVYLSNCTCWRIRFRPETVAFRLSQANLYEQLHNRRANLAGLWVHCAKNRIA